MNENDREVLLRTKSDRRLLSYAPDKNKLRTDPDRRSFSKDKANINEFIKASAKGIRYEIDYPVQIICHHGKEKKSFSCQGIDISMTGILLETRDIEKANCMATADKISLDFTIEPGTMPEGMEMKINIEADLIRTVEDESGLLLMGMRFAEELSIYNSRKKGRYLLLIASLFLFFITATIILMRTESVIYFKFKQSLYLYSIVAATFLLSRYLFAVFYRPVEIDPDYSPGVSILIPCFNEEEWIERTIMGCVNQDYPLDKLEIIVIDDASTDQSRERIKDTYWKLCEVDKDFDIGDRLKYVFLEENSGKRKALAKGLEKAKHDLIVFVDSDSFLDPFAIRNLVQPFKDPKMGGVSGRTDESLYHGHEDKGFIALSYFALDRLGDENMISMKRLEEHFEALKKNGYKTISQEDLLAYYRGEKLLPEKALFLSFEDGRRDTAVFSSKLLEKYNFTSSFFTYALNLESRDDKFIDAQDLKKMLKSGYFQAGTNGYRLSYINVFDRYGNYLGELEPEGFINLSKYLDRNYDHYLMDYIRDQEGVPKENQQRMTQRIKKDYYLMEEAYQKKLGFMPQVYILMHSNSGQFGTNKIVSQVNEDMLKKQFSMNFNREGYAHNNLQTDIYNLSRLQPQPHWYTNHLLMRIKDSTGEEILFARGDEEKAKKWKLLQGAAEFTGGKIIATSEPDGRSLLELKDSPLPQDYQVELYLKGNKRGSQLILLRANEFGQEALEIKLKDNILSITDQGDNILNLNLDFFDGKEFQTKAENSYESLEAAYNFYLKKNTLIAQQTNPNLKRDLELEEDQSIYWPELESKSPGSRKINLKLEGDYLSLAIDNKEVISQAKVASREENKFFLSSAWEDKGYSQRNLADNVYDGVFENLLIKDSEGNLIFSQEGKKIGGLAKRITNSRDSIISWIIKNL